MKSTEWIDVNDRLPDFEIPVLVVYDFGGDFGLRAEVAYVVETTQRTDKDGTKTYVEWKNSEWAGWDVTHWMPLPEFPITKTETK